MSRTLRRAVRRALANASLRAALTANAARRRAARDRARASLPASWETLRQQAAQIRRQTLAHWDELLDYFIAQARRNGFIVHIAPDAQAARRIVTDIVERVRLLQGDRPLLIVKSKSMVSEEIGLNPALEALGHRVVETDLGEFIIQLRGERPAHIITPAVHLRRQEVAQTFHERLGVPYTEEVETLTAYARQHLRRAFLQADVGISGVNFGIAATGGVCIVTNEGNGRMVTTLPPVHIALMGMERLVPTLEDLALMLRLLPRAATGQILTVYTSLLHGPRGSEDADGPQERHLVLVDNGRRRMARTALREALRCIRCGACLNACPVYREIGGHAYVGRRGESTPYPGPIGIVISAALFGTQTFGNLAQLCTLCGACTEACPVAIPLDDLIVRVRAGRAPTTPLAYRPPAPLPRPGVGAPAWLRPLLKLYAWTATRPRLFQALQRTLRPGVRWFGRWSSVAWLRGAGRSPIPLPPPVPSRPSSIPSPTSAAPSPPRATDDPVARFAQRLTALGGEVVSVSRQALAKTLRARWEALGRPAVTTWSPEAFPAGLGAILQEAALPPGPASAAEIGVTGALVGVAETGSVVIPSGPGRPQAASLLPPRHWVLLPREAVVERLEAVFRLVEIQAAAQTVLVTGPSRTADIEMTLTIGVHGPREVTVFLVS